MCRNDVDLFAKCRNDVDLCAKKYPGVILPSIELIDENYRNILNHFTKKMGTGWGSAS